MAQIDKPNLHFNTKLYTGTGSNGNAITGVGFQPDFIWIKDRVNAYSHRLYDVIRGVNSALNSDQTAAASQYAQYGQLESIDSDGFTVGQGSSNGAAMNDSGDGHVSWNWKANGAGSTNTDGNNPNTVTVSANTTAGFSIIKYQGTDTGGQTIGHGLGVKPKLFICKNMSETDNWMVWIDTTGNGTADKRIILNSNASDYGNYMATFGTSTITLPSTSDNSWNGNGDNIIGYAFAEKKGYSKIGSYFGNENTSGPFVYTGFKPSMIIIKKYSAGTAQNWRIIDNKRLGYNVNNYPLYPSAYVAEGTSETPLDILSNGFKLRSTGGAVNSNGTGYIYYAVAENPIVGSNDIPATAR